MEETDDRLLERVRISDTEAFRILFEKYQPVLFRIVLHRLGITDAAHDVVQETFLRVWQRRASLRPDLPFLAYLLRISRNLALDHLKHIEVRRRLDREIPVSAPSAYDNPEHALQLTMLEERLADVVSRKLPEKCREIFLLSRMEGMSNAEISTHLGVSVKTVENQMTRALKVIRRHLGTYTRR